MSSARSASETPAADAAALREAAFVTVAASADGDSLAASGLLARALRDCDVPFQVRVRELPDPPRTDDDLLVSVGAAGGDVAIPGDARPASVDAYRTAAELAADVDPVLALAGVVAAGEMPGGGDAADLLETAEHRELVERRPGVAVPTDGAVDGEGHLADGIAHSTLVRAPVSGDADAVSAALAGLDLPATLDADARRRVASWIAVETVDADGASPRAAEAVERFLRPYATPDGRFATVGGYADVLDAVARERPGTGVALALRDAPELRADALDAWRAHARTVHAELAGATTGRYDGLFVARVDSGTVGQLATAARLLRDFRSPEPVALVVTEGAAAAASVEDAALGDAMDEAATAMDGTGHGGSRRGRARFDDGLEVSGFITAFRGAL
ncbi:exonuclease RecJ [Salinirarus marinus]|uniref:exonuclease RecJ n=1 Tax=Salinirarus marinus TaxID=3068310 RepID=UPI003C6C16D1